MSSSGIRPRISVFHLIDKQSVRPDLSRNQ
jgi:hypothetical protein